MKKSLSILGAHILLLILIPAAVFAHCEIPCGIYGDEMRTDMIAEHIQTIEKSMNMINELSKEGDENYNQIVRWVNNKETHANGIQEIVYQYFMNQRIKPKDKSEGDDYLKYTTELTQLHEMLVSAMKAKQTTDTAHTKKLSQLLDSFKSSYFGSHTHAQPAKDSPAKKGSVPKKGSY